jgi:type IV secretion system protein VirD4
VARKLASLLLLLGFVLAGSVGATQYLARTFAYAPELGEPVASVGAARVYPPFAWYTWQRHWGRYAKKEFATSLAMAFGGLVVGLGLALRIRGTDATPKPTGAFGTARWATLRELKKARLLGDRGIVLGQTDEALIEQAPDARWVMKRRGRLLRYDGDGHTCVIANTRAGKGITVVVPTLLSYTDGSVLIHDPKGENWNITAAWRSKFSHCLRFEPTAEHSVRFNPLLEIRPAPLDVRDAQNIAEILVNPASMTDEQKDHWKLTGHAFLVGVILHVLYAEKDKSIAGVLHVLTDPERSFQELLLAMLQTRHLPTGPHPTVAGAARAMIDRSDRERASVKSTATSFLEIYRDPLIAANTSESDFRIADIMCGQAPVSLYFVVPQSDEERIRPVVRLMLNVIGRRLTEYLDHVDCGPTYQPQTRPLTPESRHPALRWALRLSRRVAKAISAHATAVQLARALTPYLRGSQPVAFTLNSHGRAALDGAAIGPGRLQPKRHELLCLLDEFIQLGRIPFFANGISSIAGYRFKCLLILQSFKQLDEVYGKSNSIIDNCTIRVTCGTLCDQTAERISRLLGTQSLIRPQISLSKRPGLFVSDQVSVSYQEYGRPLKTVDEVLSMPFPQNIILIGNSRPYLARKFLYYQDPIFKSRAGNARGDGPNRPPTSRREQRAELPPRKAPPHWLNLPLPSRPVIPGPPTVPAPADTRQTVSTATVSTATAAIATAPVAEHVDATSESYDDLGTLPYFKDFFPASPDS